MNAKQYLQAVKSLPCVLCTALGQAQESPTDAHHAREGQGMAQRAPDFLVAALCHSGCHQGPLGIHGDRTLLKLAKLGELDLVALTVEGVMRRARFNV